jgi:hypothetical protein
MLPEQAFSSKVHLINHHQHKNENGHANASIGSSSGKVDEFALLKSLIKDASLEDSEIKS